MSSLPEVDKHEEHATEFLGKIDKILIDAFRISPELDPEIFYRVSRLRDELRRLLIENTARAEREAVEKIRFNLEKYLKRINL